MEGITSWVTDINDEYCVNVSMIQPIPNYKHENVNSPGTKMNHHTFAQPIAGVPLTSYSRISTRRAVPTTVYLSRCRGSTASKMVDQSKLSCEECNSEIQADVGVNLPFAMKCKPAIQTYHSP